MVVAQTVWKSNQNGTAIETNLSTRTTHDPSDNKGRIQCLALEGASTTFHNSSVICIVWHATDLQHGCLLINKTSSLVLLFRVPDFNYSSSTVVEASSTKTQHQDQNFGSLRHTSILSEAGCWLRTSWSHSCFSLLSSFSLVSSWLMRFWK